MESCGWTCILLFTLLVIYVTNRLLYWKRKNVPYLRYGLPRIPNVYLLQEGYDLFKRQGHKFFGLLTATVAVFVITDIELIKRVLTSDFKHFNDHGIFHNEKADPLTGHLFNLAGEKWRKLRIKLTPTFTSGKMKMMFQTLVDCSKQMIDFVTEAEAEGRSIEIKEVFSCYTTDIIGSCAFGIECNSFVEGDNFRKYGKKIFETTTWRRIRRTLIMSFPRLFKPLNVKMLDEEVNNFFINALRETVEYREKNDVRRNDFLQLLIDLKNNKSLDDEGKGAENNVSLTFNELCAQAFVFFLAGFETSSTATTFCLYELALHQEIQDKVREEVKAVLKRHDGQITYDAIADMKYMQQVVDETLRKYPPLPLLFRKCSEDYVVPGTDVLIQKDTRVFIPSYQIQHDEEFYPNPEKFDPERFNEKNKQHLNAYTYLPFGEGPRICIGLRFGLMQTKVGLTTLLKNFKFTLDDSAKNMSFDPHSVILSFKNLQLKVEKISA